MSNKLPAGLNKRKDGAYEIDKHYCPGKGYKTERLRKIVKSTAKVAISALDDLIRAEYNRQVNGHKVEDKLKTWEDGAMAYLKYKNIKPNDKGFFRFKILQKYIPADLPLDHICNDTFEQLRKDSESHGLKLDSTGTPIRSRVEIVERKKW